MWIAGVQFSSVAQSCLTLTALCDTMDRSTPGLPVHHQLPKFTQTHVHWVGDAIQPSHPLLPPSPPTLNFPQHQGLFQWVGYSCQVSQNIGALAAASVLPMNIQDWFPLALTGLISLREGTLESLLKHHSSKAAIFLALSFAYSPTLTTIRDYWINHSFG